MSLQYISDLLGAERTEPCHQTLLKKIKKKSRQSFVKLRGAGTQAPPTSSWGQSLLSMTGVMLSILLVSAVNDTMTTTWGSDYEAPLGPMGALLGLQFGLTAAPAAQPRTIMVGQVVSILIALAFAEISSERAWIKQSLSCAVAVGAMAKIGVVNPPAAANAFVFASGNLGFSNMAAALLSNILAIICSIFFNNLSDKRQYPSFWGIPHILQCTMFMAKTTQNMNTEEDTKIEDLIRRTRARKREAAKKAAAENTAGAADEIAKTTKTVEPDATASDLPNKNKASSFECVKPNEGDENATLEQAEMGAVLKSPTASSMRSSGNGSSAAIDLDRSVRFHHLDTVDSGEAPNHSRPNANSRHRRSKALM